MRTRTILTGVPVALLALILLGGAATKKYVPKKNEELYGTWTNEHLVGRPPKVVISSGRFTDYCNISDTTSCGAGTMKIVSKSTDSESNVWYESTDTLTAGHYAGNRGQSLYKVSKSGTVLECVTRWGGMQHSRAFPKKADLDPVDGEYRKFYRAQ